MSTWRVFKATFRKWLGGPTFQSAAALAYYTLFSLAPMLLIAVGLAGFFLGREAAQGFVYEKTQSWMGPEAADLVQKLVQAAALEPGKIHKTALGVLGLVLGGTGIFAQLQSSLNALWSVKAAPTFSGILHFLLSRLTSLLLVLGVGLLMVASLLATTLVGLFSSFLSQYLVVPEWTVSTVNGLVSFGIFSALLSLIYKFLPDVELRWRDVAIGSIVTGLLLLLGRIILSLYLSRASVAGTFGAAGTLAVFVLWIYYSSLIFFLGAAFTQAYVLETAKPVRPTKHAVWVKHEVLTAVEP